MCLKSNEICPCCETESGGPEVITSCGRESESYCPNMTFAWHLVSRDRLAEFVCTSDNCKLNKATMDRVEAERRELGPPSIVIGPLGIGQREFDRLTREYGGLEAGAIPVSLPEPRKPLGHKKVPTATVPSNSSGNFSHVQYRMPSRGGAVKEQFRAKGNIDVTTISPEDQASIRAQCEELNKQIEAQMSASDPLVGSKTGAIAGLAWLPAEDELLQNLRCYGFSYGQISKDYIPRRTRTSLLLRRSRHRDTTHKCWSDGKFVYRPEGVIQEYQNSESPSLEESVAGPSAAPSAAGEQEMADGAMELS
ncbi:hypothetical protein V8F20_004149 [Naviculisporaceae sp. PSN 640]